MNDKIILFIIVSWLGFSFIDDIVYYKEMKGKVSCYKELRIYLVVDRVENFM